MALDQQYRKMLRDLMLESDSLSGRQTLSDGSIIGYDANTPEDMIASVANPPQPMLEIQQQQVEQPQTPQRISDLLVRQRPQDFGDQQRFDEAYQFKQQMPEGQSYLRNNTTGAVQMLPSFVRQPAMQQQPQEPSPKQIIDDLMYYAKGKSIPSDQLGKMIQYQATKAQGAPSAQDLYHEASGRGIPIETLISAYLTIGGANSAREKDRLDIEKRKAELAQMQANLQQKTPEQMGREEAAKIAARDAAIASRAAQPGTVEYKRVQDQKREEEAAKAKETAIQEKLFSAKTGAMKQLDTLGKAVGDVINAPNLKSATGVWDNMVGNFVSLTPSDKANARAYIKQLQSVSQVVGLQDLRKAGVAPGSITEREWPKFQAMIGTIDPDLSDDEFLKQMKEIQNFVNTAKEEVGTVPAEGAAVPGSQSHKADWIARAKAKNPGMSGAAIEAEYLKKFRK